MELAAKVLVLLGSAVFLTGCTAASIPEFDAEQTSTDVVVEEAQVDIDPYTTRYVGEAEGAELYLARGEGTTCLIQIRDQVWEPTGFGAGGGLGSTLQSGTRIEVGDFTFRPSEVAGGSRTQLSDSVTVISFD